MKEHDEFLVFATMVLVVVVTIFALYSLFQEYLVYQ